jgi:[ribosomal protein S5]-alanine N-acetyltransferase
MNSSTSGHYLNFKEPTRRIIFELSNARVRTWCASDIPFVQQWLQDPHMWPFLSNERPDEFLPENAQTYLMWYLRSPNTFFFAAADPQTDMPLGNICAQIGSGPYTRSAEVSGWLARPYWRSGIARSVTSAFVDWLFEKQNIVRAYAAPFEGNRASIGTLIAAGFTFESRIRASVFKSGQVMDQLMYAKINPKIAQEKTRIDMAGRSIGRRTDDKHLSSNTAAQTAPS